MSTTKAAYTRDTIVLCRAQARMISPIFPPPLVSFHRSNFVPCLSTLTYAHSIVGGGMIQVGLQTTNIHTEEEETLESSARLHLCLLTAVQLLSALGQNSPTVNRVLFGYTSDDHLNSFLSLTSTEFSQICLGLNVRIEY